MGIDVKCSPSCRVIFIADSCDVDGEQSRHSSGASIGSSAMGAQSLRRNEAIEVTIEIDELAIWEGTCRSFSNSEIFLSVLSVL